MREDTIGRKKASHLFQELRGRKWLLGRMLEVISEGKRGLDGLALDLGRMVAATPDVYIIHASRYYPQWLTSEVKREFSRAGIDPLDKAHILHQRDGTEIWYVAHPAGASKP